MLSVETFWSAESTELTLGADGIVEAIGPRPDKDTYTLTASTSLDSITAFRLEVLARDHLPMGGPGRAENGNLTLSGFEVLLFEPGAPTPKPLHIRRASADFNQADKPIAGLLTDLKARG